MRRLTDTREYDPEVGFEAGVMYPGPFTVALNGAYMFTALGDVRITGARVNGLLAVDGSQSLRVGKDGHVWMHKCPLRVDPYPLAEPLPHPDEMEVDPEEELFHRFASRLFGSDRLSQSSPASAVEHSPEGSGETSPVLQASETPEGDVSDAWLDDEDPFGLPLDTDSLVPSAPKEEPAPAAISEAEPEPEAKPLDRE